MNLKRMVCASTLAAGVGLAGLFGVGLGTASADPGRPCDAPNAPACQPGPGQDNNWQRSDDNWQRSDDNGQRPDDDWQHRGIDQGRQDHRPFTYFGQRVEPLPAGNGDGWGFWFLGQWIRL